MSERSKGDTSSSLATAAPSTSGRVVKNPLLSASVTGLTFDDFQNKPLLLPAAPPIVHPTPVVSRESTPLVTVGKSSDIDTENLSEINLNDNSITTSSSNITDTSDENSNSLIESTNQIDNSILSQAASSFSQLPSVASSVFSTFSKKFNSSPGRDDFNSNPQLNIQPFTTPFVGQASVQQSQILPPPSVFGNQPYPQHQQQIDPSPQSQSEAPPAEPPTFYSPTEVPSVPSGPTCPPPASGQNTYRLSAKKKIYAQIPGLSSSHQEPSLPASANSFPPPIGFESLGTSTYSAHPTYDKPEERKGGIFSLSNLGVPNVLQNLSGFVQSATGITQRPLEESSQTGQPDYFPQISNVNSIGVEQVQASPPAVSFFAPPGSSASQSTSFIPGQVPSEIPGTSVSPLGPFSQPVAFFQPPTSSSRPSSIGNKFSGQPAESVADSLKAFAPQQAPQPDLNSEKAASGPLPNFFGPHPAETKFSGTPPESSSEPNLNQEQANSDPLPSFFGPLPTAEGNFSGSPPKSVTPESTLQSNLNSEQSTQGTPPSFFEPPPAAETKFSGPPSKSVTPELSLQPSLFVPPTASGTNFSGLQALSDSPASLFGPPPTPITNLSGPPAKSVTPELSSQPSLFEPSPASGTNFSGLQPSLGPPPSLFGPALTAATNLSGPPSKSVTPESSLKPHLISNQAAAGPHPNLFPNQPPTNFSGLRPSSDLPPSFFGPPPTAGTSYSGQPPKSSTPDLSFVSQQNQSSVTTTNLFGPQPTFGVNFSGSLPAGSPVPLATQLPPQKKIQVSAPPSACPPSSSFRLQKGTRLYKSPFAQNTLPPAPESVNFFSPQNVFAPPQVQGIPQPIPIQESILKPFQQASILPPKDNSVLHTSASAPPIGKAPEHLPNAEVVNFFNPQVLSSDPAIPDPTKTTAQLSILEPSAVNTVNFFNPLGLNSSPSLREPTKKETPQPPAGVNVPQIVSECPINSEEANSQKTAPSSARLDTETVTLPADQSFVPNQNLSTEENYFSNKTTEQVKLTQSEQEFTINSESEVKQESLTLLQEQQNNPLPPPPAVSFGISTPSKETANFPPPPPQHSFQNKPTSNPYRKGLQPAHSQFPAPTSLSSFFTPIDQGNNFFQIINSGPIPEVPQPAASFVAETSFVHSQEKALKTLKAPQESSQGTSTLSEETSTPLENQQIQTELTELEPSLPIKELSPISPIISEHIQLTSSKEQLKPEIAEKNSLPQISENPLSFYKPDIVPPCSNELSVASKPEESSKIASPLKSQDNPVPEPVPNLFTGFFDQTATVATPAVTAPNPIVVQRPSLPDPTTFFDSFSLVPSLGVPAPPTEDPNSQRIQNFFNNPPPKELDTVGDLNYNLVGSGLSVQNLQIRSLTPASNLAEPPSSSCSEFSELNSSLSAANRQPLIQAADSTKVSPEEEAVFESPEYQDLPEEIVNELKMANSMLGNNESPTNEAYKPAVKHWFYKRKLDVKCLWTPFSFHDSALLEAAFLKGDKGSNLVAVEGGRFDVNISERTKSPVYWEGEPIEVKRCSWFYKASDSKYVPYEEETADLLEEEYKKASESCEWHKKIPISAGDIVVFHGPTVIVHFQPQQQVDSWGGSTLDSESFISYMKQQTITRPRVVKRDLDDFQIDEGESHKVDHLLFMVHGIGSACDLKMRSVEEVVDEFRSIALQLVQSHYKNSVESGCVGRVEVLPVSWHSELHSDEFGIDEKLKSITLESIPKLRNFTNDTLLDILFYTSPMFCQRIINTVTSSMNDIFVKYKQRNPEFHGEVSLAGHSLGSLIMFDLLCHQRPHKQSEEKNMENPDQITSDFPVESNKLKEEEEGKNITYKMGQAGTGQPFISYPQLLFQPKKFFALGSPIGMFVTIRGIDKLGLDFRLPTCPGFYNIFHPYDPVAYRLEALVNPDMNGIPPVLIPHHKGRKRMHLELKETMSRVGADLKQRFFETFKTTLDSVSFLTPKAKNDPKELKEEVDRLLELQAQQGQQTQQSIASTSRSRANSSSTNQSDTDVIEIDFPLGKLNDSKRVDYVLQEAPLEFFNEYLFALSSHVCYWESEDTILFVMKQIYNEIGISPDSQVPQQSMTIERPSSSGSTTQQSPTS